MITHLIAANYGVGIIPEFMQGVAKQDIVFKNIEELKGRDYPLIIAVAYNKNNKNSKLENFLSLL